MPVNSLRTVVALLALLYAAAAAPSQTPIEQILWPNGAPGALGAAPKDRPKLLVWPAKQDDGETPAVVVCPGGGYGHLAMDHEGKQIATWLNSIGVTAAVLDYRHRGKGYGHPAPLRDAQRALRVVRANAASWRIDPKRVGVLGFSAGGHLASSVCVHHDGGGGEDSDPVERMSCRPDFAVLCYAVLAFDRPFTHRGSQRNLLGEDAAAPLVAEMSSERQVDANTPPTFLWHTTADRAVPVENSLAYYAALRRAGVPCELHCFEHGRHGIGLGRGLAASAWPRLCRRWLVARGVLDQ